MNISYNTPNVDAVIGYNMFCVLSTSIPLSWIFLLALASSVSHKVNQPIPVYQNHVHGQQGQCHLEVASSIFHC